jgi:hypothetical protein
MKIDGAVELVRSVSMLKWAKLRPISLLLLVIPCDDAAILYVVIDLIVFITNKITTEMVQLEHQM